MTFFFLNWKIIVSGGLQPFGGNVNWKETEGWKSRKDTKFNYAMTMQPAKLFADWQTTQNVN